MTIARVLSQSPNCICLHEPKPLFVKESSLFHYGELGSVSIREILRETRQPIVRRKIYGESNQKLSMLIPILAEEFPKAQFVWLVRDGRDVVASMMARRWYESLETTICTRPELSEKELDWTRYRLDGSKTGDFSSGKWKTMSRFEKCCWRWSKVNSVIEQDLNQIKSAQFILVRMEDMESEIDKIALKLGVARPITGFKIKKYNFGQTQIKSWSAWTDSEKKIFTSTCKTMMNKLYPDWYNRNGSWQRYVPKGKISLSLSEKFKTINLQAASYLRMVIKNIH